MGWSGRETVLRSSVAGLLGSLRELLPGSVWRIIIVVDSQIDGVMLALLIILIVIVRIHAATLARLSS